MAQRSGLAGNAWHAGKDRRRPYELALVLAEIDRPGDTVAHLEAALAVWAEADHSFKPAQQAREKLAELTGDK
jgi:hypothetical protein